VDNGRGGYDYYPFLGRRKYVFMVGRYGCFGSSCLLASGGILMRIKEDIQTMWERGVSVHVIAKKYSCEPIDIMRILGIWE
jgi:hypothetical protein